MRASIPALAACIGEHARLLERRVIDDAPECEAGEDGERLTRDRWCAAPARRTSDTPPPARKIPAGETSSAASGGPDSASCDCGWTRACVIGIERSGSGQEQDQRQVGEHHLPAVADLHAHAARSPRGGGRAWRGRCRAWHARAAPRASRSATGARCSSASPRRSIRRARGKIDQMRGEQAVQRGEDRGAHGHHQAFAMQPGGRASGLARSSVPASPNTGASSPA